MLKSMFKLFFLVSLLSFFMLALTAMFTDTIQPNSLLIFFGYFFLTLFTLKFYKEKLPTNLIVTVLFASVFFIQSYTIYICFAESLFPLPFILIYCLGIISAFFYFILKRPINLLPFILSFSFVIFMFFQGWTYWVHLSNFGTFTGRVNAYNTPTNFLASNEQKSYISDKDFKDKLILLDFWTTTCGICFQKFPQLQTVYNKYKNDSSVIILAVNTPIEEDKPNQAYNDIREKGHSFPVVITKDEDLAEKWGVKGYPTTFVINPNGQIVYKGDIEGAVKMVDELKSNMH